MGSLNLLKCFLTATAKFIQICNKLIFDYCCCCCCCCHCFHFSFHLNMVRSAICHSNFDLDPMVPVFNHLGAISFDVVW